MVIYIEGQGSQLTRRQTCIAREPVRANHQQTRRDRRDLGFLQDERFAFGEMRISIAASKMLLDHRGNGDLDLVFQRPDLFVIHGFAPLVVNRAGLADYPCIRLKNAMGQCSRCQQPVDPDAQRCPHCGAWLGQQPDAPEPNPDSLESEIRSLLTQGQKIAAIKLYRERTGVGLAEAKNAVERIERGEGLPDNKVAATAPEQQILQLLAAGKKIAAIKLYREQTHVGLKEAKEAVEALAAQNGIVPPPRSGCFAVLALLLSGVLLVLVGWLHWR
jgi:ribosomal protein L7/L12